MMNKEVKNIYGGELVSEKDVIWDDDKEVFICKKELEEGKYYSYDCDVSSGADSTVIVVRKGRDLVAIKRYKGEDTMEIVGRVIDAIREYQPALTVIDEGGLGYGVLDRLTEQRYKVRGVNFGWKAKNPITWGNKRAEMWVALS